MDVKKRFFTKKVAGHCNRLPSEVVKAPSLSDFKEGLDDALSHIIICRQSCKKQGVGLGSPHGPLPAQGVL